MASRKTLANAIRALAMDAVQKANSGHPGAPMGQAAMAYMLWSRFLRFDPQRPDWPNRDRFVLSCGHASALLYALLHLTGYEEVSLDELRRFRTWESRTGKRVDEVVISKSGLAEANQVDEAAAGQ